MVKGERQRQLAQERNTRESDNTTQSGEAKKCEIQEEKGCGTWSLGYGLFLCGHTFKVFSFCDIAILSRTHRRAVRWTYPVTGLGTVWAIRKQSTTPADPGFRRLFRYFLSPTVHGSAKKRLCTVQATSRLQEPLDTTLSHIYFHKGSVMLTIASGLACGSLFHIDVAHERAHPPCLV